MRAAVSAVIRDKLLPPQGCLGVRWFYPPVVPAGALQSLDGGEINKFQTGTNTASDSRLKTRGSLCVKSRSPAVTDGAAVRLLVEDGENVERSHFLLGLRGACWAGNLLSDKSQFPVF